jgi:sigma-E factor negative regulatory protein RseC
MVETRATVIKIEAHAALVVTNNISACEQCKGQGCGSSKVAQLFCSQSREFLVENPIRAVVGDDVIVAVTEGVLLQSVSVMYLLPLMVLVLVAGLVSLSGGGEGAVALGALAGLALGFMLAKWVSSRLVSSRQPCIARLYIAN